MLKELAKMLTKSEQAVFRPLVEKAWIKHCVLMEISPNNRPAKDAWYRDQVHSTIGKWSTRDADPVIDYQNLIDRFMLLAGDPQLIIIRPWSTAQNEWANKEAHKAFEISQARGVIDDMDTFESFFYSILAAHRIDTDRHLASDKTKSFDEVMAHLGTITGDERLISHFSESMEIRVRFQIERFMADLTWLEGEIVTWEYVRGIWTQAELLPDLAEAPASTLIKVLQMLDSHIRRRCKAREIRPRCLPTRCPGSPSMCDDPVCPGGMPTSGAKTKQENGCDDIPF